MPELLCLLPLLGDRRELRQQLPKLQLLGLSWRNLVLFSHTTLEFFELMILRSSFESKSQGFGFPFYLRYLVQGMWWAH